MPKLLFPIVAVAGLALAGCQPTPEPTAVPTGPAPQNAVNQSGRETAAAALAVCFEDLGDANSIASGLRSLGFASRYSRFGYEFYGAVGDSVIAFRSLNLDLMECRVGVNGMRNNDTIAFAQQALTDAGAEILRSTDSGWEVRIGGKTIAVWIDPIWEIPRIYRGSVIGVGET